MTDGFVLYDIAEVERRLRRGESPDMDGTLDMPLIFVGLARQDEALVLLLLDHGARIDVVDRMDHTLLQRAVDAGLSRVVDRLIERGADPDVLRAGSAPLRTAASLGALAMVRRLLNAGACVDRVSFANETPLMAAAGGGHDAVVVALLRAGADVNAASTSGYTPLIEAASFGHVATAKILLAHGADPLARDASGKNATDWAREKYDPIMAESFRALGIPDVYSLDPHKRSTFDGRASYGVFISYRQAHYADDVDALRSQLLLHGRPVFVDRHELSLDPDAPEDFEVVKLNLREAVSRASLLVFIEINWNGSFGMALPARWDFNWQFFELLHARDAVLVALDRRTCARLIVEPGRSLRSEPLFEFDDFADLSRRLAVHRPAIVAR